MSAILFDLGGTYFRSAFVNVDSNITSINKIKMSSLVNTDHKRNSWDYITNWIIDEIHSFTGNSHHHLTVSVVISFPGPIEKDNKILFAPTISGNNDVPDLANIIKARTGHTVYILNDLSAAAWSFVPNSDISRFLVVTVSSGIGSKIVDIEHPKKVLDTPNYAGELGHIVIDYSKNAPLCDCGQYGHLGAIASGRGIEHLVNQARLQEPTNFSRSLLATKKYNNDIFTNEEHIIPALLDGDDWVSKLVARATRPLAQVLSYSLVACGLQRIIVIGGFALAGSDCYMQILKQEMKCILASNLLSIPMNNLLQLGNDSPEICLQGTLAYYRQQLQNIS